MSADEIKSAGAIPFGERPEGAALREAAEEIRSERAKLEAEADKVPQINFDEWSQRGKSKHSEKDEHQKAQPFSKKRTTSLSYRAQ